MAVLKRIASLTIPRAVLALGVLIASITARAQIPDLQDKAAQLTAEVRERGSDMRPLYQDVEQLSPMRKYPRKPRNRHGRSRRPLKPARGVSKGPSTHAAPSRSSQ